ncbi:uncharacterized protein LOC110862349 [Folsomia candida]|uniref:Uncharacterized protein n=1 Tax=Folsomia candida TaxID=158441 RepID=A0A226CW93_FOLCA|nr:uncharacterized protein LOC110862349 [Folsomia candida]OXA37622.1 hypothetical protein Fcan01_27621 [Folsomia candida]
MGVVETIKGTWTYIAAIVFIAISGGLCLGDVIDLSGRSVKLPLATFSARAEFTFRYLTLGVLSVLCTIFLVIFQRVTTGTVNPLAGQEDKVQKQANILQNSFEQFIISAFAQLCMVSFIGEKYTLRVIPWVNFCFIIGRFFFVIGYPSKRAFGVFLSLIPNVGMVGVCVYKFVEHLFFDSIDV